MYSALKFTLEMRVQKTVSQHSQAYNFINVEYIITANISLLCSSIDIESNTTSRLDHADHAESCSWDYGTLPAPLLALVHGTQVRIS